MPTVAMIPPSMAVRRRPNESIMMPATGDTRKVVPIDSDPTSAAIVTQSQSVTVASRKIITTTDNPTCKSF